MKVTAPQLAALRQCEREVSLIVGGIDDSGVRLDVCRRLALKGLLKWHAASGIHEHSEWRLTDAGHETLKANPQ